MKHFSEVNYYDLLEVNPTSNYDEIRRSYEMMKKAFADESIASYSLMDAETRIQFMQRVEEAFSVLGDEVRRREYDLRMGIRPPVPQENEAGPASIDAREPESPVSPSAPPPTVILMPGPVDESDLNQQEWGGPLLKTFRERRGIPLQEIAAKTRISITYLQYIEQDYFKGLPAEVYLRGYLSQYAKAIGLDPVHVVEKYLLLYKNWIISNPSSG